MNEAVIIRNSRGALAFTFLAGVAIGVFSGAALVRKAMQEQMSEQIEEEFARLQARYSTGGLTKPYSTPAEAVEKLHPGLTNNFQPPVAKREHVAYEKIREFEPNAVAPDVDMDPEEEHALEAEFGPTPPELIYKITFEEFYESGDKHVQESLMYYPVDDVITDPNNTVVENYPKFLGRKFLEGLAQSAEPYDTHVRNDELKIDYEITILPGQSYRRDVMNEDEEELTDRQRINGA